MPLRARGLSRTGVSWTSPRRPSVHRAAPITGSQDLHPEARLPSREPAHSPHRWLGSPRPLAIPWRGRRPQTRRCHRRTCHSESKYRGSGSLVLGRTSINANQIRRRANREGNQYAAPARGPHDRLDRPLWRRHDSSCSMQLEACHWRSSLLLNHASRRRPSVPLVPTLVSLCSTSVYKRRNQRDTSNSMILVRLWI